MPQTAKPYMAPLDDGRRKIDPALHDQIRQDYKIIQSQRKLAVKYHCSRRLIVFILFPERYKTFLERRKVLKVHKLYKEGTEERRITMEKYRAKKRAKGLIVIKNPKAYAKRLANRAKRSFIAP